MQVILDFLFSRPGSTRIVGGKKREFRDWTRSQNTTKKYKNDLKSGNTGNIFLQLVSQLCVALQVETHCCPYYHVCDQLVSQQNTDYLHQVTNARHRIALTKLRLSNHKLAIETGRYSRPFKKPAERICPICKIEMEDEYHFLNICPAYQEKRCSLLDYLEKEYRI